MPTYTFRCQKCGETVEVEHSMQEPHPELHAGCGGRLSRIFNSQPHPIYKGAGFYTTEKRLAVPETELE